jgi:glycine cleavage system pyridoxal-binding protein P
LNFKHGGNQLTGMEITLTRWKYCAGSSTIWRESETKKNNVCKFFVSEEILPQTLSVLQTRQHQLVISCG